MNEPATSGAFQRLQISMQRTRAAAFVLLYLIVLLGHLAGQTGIDWIGANTLLLVSLGSVCLFELLYRRGIDRPFGIEITPLWMLLDVLFITWGIHLSNDVAGPWMVWYLANTAAATFVSGPRATLLVALTNCAAYLALLRWRGDLASDADLGSACFRLLLVYGASFIFLRGIADLRRKRLEIRHLMEEKNRRLVELGELATALDLRTRELAEANLRSQEASRAKSQFLANMSHELRTPLNSIIGFSEILSERQGDTLGPRYGKFLGNILHSGRHLLRLINDILDLSKIEAGKMELTLEQVSVRDVIHGVRSVMLGISSQRRIDLDLDLPEGLPTLIADGPKVKQILYNLVSNAVKFSPDGSVVTLGARCLAPLDSPLDAETLELFVEDQGLGIAPEHQQTIFEEFRQVEGDSARTHGGTGLGLTLVKRFVQMHGGRVSLDSSPGQGSTFHVFLPFDASQILVVPKTAEVAIFTAEQLAAAQRLRQTTDTSIDLQALDPDRPRVLIVEDDETFGQALVQDLEAAGYVALWIRHGEDALQHAQTAQPAVITLDLALPGLDGWEILKTLKGDPTTAQIPVIIVSLVENHELGFALGADDYFLKPLERRHFLERVEGLARGELGSPRTILVVDDDPQVHDLLDDSLSDAGFRLLSAHDGRSGLAMARREQPSIVVLDLMMPEMNGFEVASRLRADPATASLPIVVLTAKELSTDDRTQLTGKIEGLLSKAPMDRAELLRTIQSVAVRSVSPPNDDAAVTETEDRLSSESGVEGRELAAEAGPNPEEEQDRHRGETAGETEP